MLISSPLTFTKTYIDFSLKLRSVEWLKYPETSRDSFVEEQESQMPHDLESLPPEIILEILSFLDTKSLCQASQTCKKWFDFIYNSDIIWKSKCRSLDREEVEKDIQTGCCRWRSIFIRNYGTNLVKKRWFEGKYTHVKSHDELSSNHLGPLSTETWGSILDMEIHRNS